MRNREEFEGRVYELYELKKKKRVATIKKFTVAATTLVAAACIVLVFSRFNREVKNPPTQGETFAESATNVGNDADMRPTGEWETGVVENIPEGDGMDGMNGIPENDGMDSIQENYPDTVAIGWFDTITLQSTKETVAVDKGDGEVLFVRLYNAEVEEASNYECQGEVYLFEGEDDKGEIAFIYSEGHVKLQDGEWMRLETTAAEYVDGLIEELFE